MVVLVVVVVVVAVPLEDPAPGDLVVRPRVLLPLSDFLHSLLPVGASVSVQDLLQSYLLRSIGQLLPPEKWNLCV